MIDHILLIGFGGPEKEEDIWPFLRNVTAGRNIPDARLQKVYDQYVLVGGKSPYNQQVFELLMMLDKALKKNKTLIPVFVGMRNWAPYLKDTLGQIHSLNLKKGLAIILAPQRSVHSCYQYKQNLMDAKKELGCEELNYEFATDLFSHPLLISGISENLEKVISQLNPSLKTKHIFVAHSIPEESLQKCSLCNYQEQVEKTSQLVADTLGIVDYEVAYQSRSGNPRQPWLAPDINSLVEKFSQDKVHQVVVTSVGFLFENVEILFDLDTDFKERCAASGMTYFRSETIGLGKHFQELLLSKISSNLR